MDLDKLVVPVGHSRTTDKLVYWRPEQDPNLLLLGRTAVGKTTTAKLLAARAASLGYLVYGFYEDHHMGGSESRPLRMLEEMLQQALQGGSSAPTLIVGDSLMTLSFDAAELLKQLVQASYITGARYHLLFTDHDAREADRLLPSMFPTRLHLKPRSYQGPTGMAPVSEEFLQGEAETALFENRREFTLEPLRLPSISATLDLLRPMA